MPQEERDALAALIEKIGEDEWKVLYAIYNAGYTVGKREGFRDGKDIGESTRAAWWFPLTVLISGIGGIVFSLLFIVPDILSFIR